GEDAAGYECVAQVGRGEKSGPPGANRVRGTRGVRSSLLVARCWRVGSDLARLAAVVPGRLQRQVHPVVNGVVRGLEAERQQGLARPRRGTGRLRLQSVEQAAVGGMQPSLGDLAHGPGGGAEVVEADPAGGLEGRAVL